MLPWISALRGSGRIQKGKWLLNLSNKLLGPRIMFLNLIKD